MRKYLILFMTLCALSAARGQTYWHYDYWFDSDREATLRTGTNGNGSNSFQIDADVSNLSEGLHAITIQMVGQSNAIVGFSKFKNEAYSDTVSKQMSDMLNQEVEVQIEDVVVNTERQTMRSVPFTRYFVKTAEQTTARCWFDNDLSTLQTGVATGSAVMLDVEGLRDGFHLLNVQAEGADAGLSVPKVFPFVKIPQVVGVDYLTCLCMIDDQLYRQERVAASGGAVAWQFDVASLPQGFHRIYVQVITPSGAATNLYQGFFFRETTHAEFGEMKCVYAIDGSDFSQEAGRLANGTFHFDIDVASLSDGLHRLSYMLSNGKGVTTKVQTQFFTKIPLGGYGTVEYWYWLNDREGDAIHKTTVDPRQNPFSLLTLLPVEEVPLRSSCFEFRIVGGQPTIYAKNDFHARFYDASGRFVDLNRQYVDERVSQQVSESTLLQAIVLGSRAKGPMLAPEVQTIKSVQLPRPGNNEITWFRMEAVPGDSLQFRLDRAATLQLFAPLGREVYRAEGADAVKWGGIHADETGTYYLCVHDVTATSGSTLTLYYEFIDRYAVLRQDIATVGNGGPSTITFQGNGFDELTRVSLRRSGNSSATQLLNSVEIGHETNATTSVKFDFGGAPLGQYDAVFHFGDEEIIVEQCVTVEQAVPVVIDGYLSYQPNFLVALGNTYEFHLTNHGNQTAYDQQFILCIYAADEASLEWVTIGGRELTDFEVIDDDSQEGLPYVRRYVVTTTLRPLTTETLLVKVKTAVTGTVHVVMQGIAAGMSNAVASLDPNDIYGYVADDGSRVIPTGVTQVYYTIEFENDPEFATASAHEIRVTDQLPTDLFDLVSFMPTRVKIGSREVALASADSFTTTDGQQVTFTTIDMRPQINAVAEVKCEYDPLTGLAQWHIRSLDPMTMELTTEPMDGVLPVNDAEGSGIGQLSFDIALKPGLKPGTEIPNKATIVFDTNEPIETPTWVNIIGSGLDGDVNQDGQVGIGDIIAITNVMAGTAGSDAVAGKADINGDGDVGIGDIIAVTNIMAGQ